MCGIFGQFKSTGASLALVECMARRLTHRGPDGYGTAEHGYAAFGAGRLAIIDLSAPVGPLYSEDRRKAVVFNGEIYNYKALRVELEASGHHFATRTDTEVLVHGYEVWGVDVLSRLNGMFALGIWDLDTQQLLIARDRLGEKPLYFAYREQQHDFLFASEIKALLEDPTLPREVNLQALPLYLALGYVPPPQTLFEGIEKVAPGEYLLVNAQGIKRARYWQPQMDTRTPMSYQQAVERTRHAVIEAVETRLMSDVPIGAFLSGGVDSTAVVALMQQALGKPVKTFTVGFQAKAGSKVDLKFNVDVQHAAQAAQALGTHHYTISLRGNADLARLLPQLVYMLDEPISQSAILQTVYVAALARHTQVPVMLSGDGSDELFLGYPHYRADLQLQRYLRMPSLVRSALLNPIFAKLPERLLQAANLRQVANKSHHAADPTRRYLEWMRVHRLATIPSLLTTPTPESAVYTALAAVISPLMITPQTDVTADRIAYTSLRLWIAEDSNMRVDKMCMMMSIESRAPLLDHRLVELALTIPAQYKLRGGDFKRVLKDAIREYVPNKVLTRPKWGFFSPVSEWLRTAFRPLVEQYLSAKNVAKVGIFDPDVIQRLVTAHIHREQYALWEVWSLLMFHLWHAIYIERSLEVQPLITADELATQSDVTSVR